MIASPPQLGAGIKRLVGCGLADGHAYTVGFAGRLDPDHGLPFISVCQPGMARSDLIWMDTSACDDGGEELHFVKPPAGLPSRDPLGFAKALGCPLPHNPI